MIFFALCKNTALPSMKKKLGQLFCDDRAQQIIDMLLTECRDAGVTVEKSTNVEKIEKTETGYLLATDHGKNPAHRL